MKIELSASELLDIEILITGKSKELLEKGAVYDEEKWSEYKKLLALSRKIWTAYKRASRAEQKQVA